MAQVGLSEAARLTRKAHTTIHRAIKTGRLSFTLDAAGERRIDTAELDRVFGLKISPMVNLVDGVELIRDLPHVFDREIPGAPDTQIAPVQRHPVAPGSSISGPRQRSRALR